MELSELLEQQFILPSIPESGGAVADELGRPEVDLRKVTS
jgi:hypothetical protein